MGKRISIELTGIPGSGKTVLSGYLTEHLNSQGFSARLVNGFREKFQRYSLGKKGIAVASAVSRNIVFMNTFPWGDILGFHSDYRNMIIKEFLVKLLERDSEERKDNGIVIYDESVVHKAYTLFVHAQGTLKEKSIKRYGDKVALPDILVHLKVSSPEAFERVVERGMPFRMQQVDKKTALEMLKRGEAFLDSYISYLQKKRGGHVIAIDMDDFSSGREKAVSSVLDYLKINR